MENKKIEENAQEQLKKVNPSTDKGNYLVQIIDDDKVIRTVIALNSTINITSIGDQALTADIK